jgi:hypothetical protein
MKVLTLQVSNQDDMQVVEDFITYLEQNPNLLTTPDPDKLFREFTEARTAFLEKPKPVYVNMRGEEIFEGDTVYIVNEDDKPFSYKVDNVAFLAENENVRIFKTFADAQIYIDLHSKDFSIYDLIAAGVHGVIIDNLYTKRANEMVRQTQNA